jgi:hypothetical protein
MKRDVQVEYRTEHKASLYVLAVTLGLLVSFIIVYGR